MPELSKLASPINTREFVNPVTTHLGSRVGSADTSLGRLIGGNYYDRGLLNYEDQANVRYENQGYLNAFGNFMGDLGVKTLSGIPSILGSITALVGGTATALNGGKFSSGFDDNPFLNMADSVSAWGTEYFPHFQQADFNDRSFWQQLTSPGQLATANVETLGFLAQSFGIAGLVGKAQLGTRAVNALAKGRTFGQVLAESNPQNLGKIAQVLDEIGVNAFLTTNESALEALDSRKQVEDKLHGDRINGLNNMTDEEIKAAADNSLTNVFWLNMLSNSVTNGFFARLTSPLYSKSLAETRANKLGLMLAKDGEETVTRKALSGLEKFILDKGNVGASVAKGLAEQIISEGAEENFQYSIQKVNDASNLNRTFSQSAMDYIKDVLQFDFSDPDRVKATGLGSLLGGGQTLVASAVGKFTGLEMGPAAEAKNYRKAQEEAVAKLNKSYTDFFSTDLLKKDSEGKLVLDENGQPQKDEVNATKFAGDVVYHGELDNLIDLEASKANPDPAKLKLYQLEKLSALAQVAFETGTTDLLLQKLDTYKNPDQSKLEVAGLLDSQDINAGIEEWKSHIQKLEANYKQVTNSILYPVRSPKDEMILSQLKKEASNVGSRIVNLLTIRGDIDAQLNTAIAKSQDPQRAAAIVEGFSKDTLDIIDKYTSKDATHLEEAQIAKLTAQRSDLDAAIKELGSTYEKLINPKKGFKNYKAAVEANSFQEYLTKRDANKILSLDEKSSKQSVGSYLDKRANTLKQANKLRLARTFFYSDAINQLDEYVNTATTPEYADSLVKLLNTAEQNHLNFYPAEIQKLKEHIDTLHSRISEEEANIDGQAQAAYGVPADSLLDNADELDDAGMALLDRYEELEKTKQVAAPLISDLEKTVKRLSDLETLQDLSISEEDFRIKAVEELMAPAQRLQDSSNYDGKSIAQDFTDYSRVEKEANYLQLLEKNLPDNLVDTPVHKSLLALIENLAVIAKLAKKNTQDRDAKNKQENEHYAKNTVALLSYLAKENQQISNLAKSDILLAELAALDHLRKQEPVILGGIKNQLIQEVLDITKELTDIQHNSVPLFNSAIGGPVNISAVQELMVSPIRGINALLERIEHRVTALKGNNNTKPLEDLVRTYDVVEFLRKADTYSGVVPVDIIKKLLSLSAKFKALQEATHASTVNAPTFLSRLREFVKTSELIPSTAQVRVARELVSFVSSPTVPNGKLFENGAALRAPAGSGKSLVVSKMVTALSGLKPTQILTAAPYTLAAQNIAHSVGLGDGMTVGAITKVLEEGTVDPKIKLIILDEAGALEIKQLNDFAKAVAKYNTEHPENTLKFVLLYDPNQVTPGNVSKPALDLEWITKPSSLETDYYSGGDNVKAAYEHGQIAWTQPYSVPFVHNLIQISPLSATYRSPVAEIVDIQNQFKTESEVGTVYSASSSTPSINIKNIYGAYAEADNTIVKNYRASEIANPGRTDRVIIVGSEQKKQQYQTLLPQAKVLLVPESAGISASEVYVDLGKEDHPYFSSPSVFNQWMYTALSRARDFVQVSNILDSKHIVDPKIEPLPLTTQDKTELMDKLKLDIDTLSVVGDEIVIPEVQVLEEPQEVAEEPESVIVDITPEEDITPTGAAPIGPLVGAQHKLWHPSSQAFTPQSELVKPLAVGDVIQVFKDHTPKKDGSSAERFVLLKPISDEGTVVGWQEVGVLNEKEVDIFESTVGLSIKSLSPSTMKRYDNGLYSLVNEGGSAHLTVQNSTRDIQYEYSPTSVEDVKDVAGLSAITKRWLDTMWDNASDAIINYDDILNSPDKYLSVVVFRNPSEVAKMFPDTTDSNALPRLGPPYLILRGAKTVTGRPIKTQFIRLTPKILSTDSLDMSPMFEFLDKLKKFEAALAASQLPGALSKLSNGIPLDIQGKLFFPFHSVVVELSNAQSRAFKGETDFTVEFTKSPPLKSILPDVDINDIPKELLDLASELDRLVHGDVEEKKRRDYKGKAQAIMHAIGSQNLVITSSLGKNYILRDYPAHSSSDSAGISLLGPIKFVSNNEKGLPYNPIIKKELQARLENYRQSLKDRGREGTIRYHFISTLLDSPGNKHLSPLTTADIEDIFVKGKDDNGVYNRISEGYGLRTPLPKNFLYKNNTDVSNLPLELLESTFVKVKPTQIVVGLDTPVAEPTVSTKNVRELSTQDKIKVAVNNGASVEQLQKDYTEEDLQVFAKSQGHASLSVAVESYKEAGKQKRFYTTNKGKTILGAVKASIELTDLEQAVKQDLINSISVVDMGRKAGRVGSRDFIRASVLAKVFQANSSEDIFAIADLVRQDYFSGKEFTKEDFLQEIEFLATTRFNLSMEEVEDRIYEIQQIYEKEGYAFGAQPMPKVDAYDSIQHIVGISHLYRKAKREGTKPSSIVPTIEEVNAGKVPDALPHPTHLTTYLRNVIQAAEKGTLEFEAAMNADPKLAKRLLDANPEDPYTAALELLEASEIERSKTFLTEVGTELTDEDINSILNRYTNRSPMNFLRRILGRPESPLYRIVKYGQLVNSRGQKVWGLYKEGVLNFARLASGNVSSKLVRHEIFHKLFWEYLTPGEQVWALDLAKETFGNLDNESLEERLAESFEDFVQTKQPSIFQMIWDRILRLLGFTANNFKSLDRFFNYINRGSFSSKPTTTVERAAINIRAKFGSFKEYALVKGIILETFSSIEEARRDGRVLSFQEILEETVDVLKGIANGDTNLIPARFTPEERNHAVYLIKKVLKDGKLWRNIVEAYFGQTQTRSAILKASQSENTVDLERDEQLNEDLKNAIEDPNSEEDDPDEADLKGEMYDHEIIDPVIKLTGAIKQRLVTIPYYKGGKKEYADINRAYSIILDGVTSIPTSSLKEALEAIKRNFAPHFSLRAKPNIRQAVSSYFYRQTSDLLSYLERTDTAKNVTFRKDANFTNVYAIYSLDGSSVAGVSLSQARSNPQLYGFELADSSIHDLVTVVSEKTGVPYKSVAQEYYAQEDIDFFKILIGGVSSLRKSRPLGFSESWVGGRYRISNYLIKTGGGRRTHESNIIGAFSRYTSRLINEGVTELFPAEFVDKVLATSTTGGIDAKREVIKDFLKLIGLRSSIATSANTLVEQAFEKLPLAIRSMRDAFSEEYSPDDETREEYLARISGDELLKNENSFLYDLSDVLNSHNTLGETHSYTRGDGKKAYGWIDASYQTSVLTAISNAKVGRAYKVFPTFQINNGKLTSKDPFLKDNIFMNNINVIHSFNDYDSWKQVGNERWAKTIRRETLKDFRRRNIVGNFISRLSYSKGRYYQALPIPSNRTTVQNIEVNVLLGNRIDAALSQIIKAQKNRPNPESSQVLKYNENYNKKNAEGIPNYKQWKLAGLSGSVDELTPAQALIKVRDYVASEVEKLMEDFVGSPDKQPKIRVPERDLQNTASVLSAGKIPAWNKNASPEELMAYWSARNKVMQNILTTFYYNYIINQYSLSQILYSDESFYKSMEDQTKRIQIVTATGDTLIVDDKYGLPPTSRVLVVKDLVNQVPDDLEGVIDESQGAEYDASDAEGYMLPEFYERIAASYGFDAATDTVMKPVYYSIVDGAPQAIKYSVKVLTDEICKQFPHLDTYREAMRNAPGGPVEQLVFASAVKIGLPTKTKLATLHDDTGEIKRESITPESILTIDNANFRFQLNPSADVEKTVANPSQLTAMQNTNGANTGEIYDLHSDNALIIDSGLRGLARELRLTRKGSISSGSERKIREKLKSVLEGLPGGRDVFEILSASVDGASASLSLPLIADRVVSSLSSMVSSATTGFRFQGSKLVLQADLGLQDVYDEKTGKYERRKLKWRDEDGFCEVILPKEYAEHMSIGDVIGVKDGIIGFRIPSTNYHSGLPMKVVGFYPTVPGSKGNVVIAPSLIVYYHGSDYDIDTLFVLRKGRADKEVKLNTILQQVDPNFVPIEGLDIEKDELVGFKDNTPTMINGVSLQRFLYPYLGTLSAQLEKLTADMAAAKYNERAEYLAKINILNGYLGQLVSTITLAAQNNIIHNFSTNMRDMKNRRDLLTPISFDDVIRIRAEIKDELAANLTNESFLRKLAAAGLIEIKC